MWEIYKKVTLIPWSYSIPTKNRWESDCNLLFLARHMGRFEEGNIEHIGIGSEIDRVYVCVNSPTCFLILNWCIALELKPGSFFNRSLWRCLVGKPTTKSNKTGDWSNEHVESNSNNRGSTAKHRTGINATWCIRGIVKDVRTFFAPVKQGISPGCIWLMGFTWGYILVICGLIMVNNG